MSNDNLIYKKAIRILGKESHDYAKEFANDYQIAALRQLKDEHFSKAVLFDNSIKLGVLEILGDKDIETTIFISDVANEEFSKWGTYTNEWKALEYLKNHRLVEYAFYYGNNYQMNSLVTLGRDNADISYKFDSRTKYDALNTIGFSRNNSQKALKIAGEFIMLNKAKYEDAFDVLAECARSSYCKSYV